ncbi:hypothetical protein J14TS5_31800 [Paenibacillus lautus]|nr:hypothetical protein J14TS5_31800 [Paenibacillus lautus]
MIDMAKDFAKLTGELAKGTKIGESTIEIKLTFPLKATLPHLVFLSNNQGENSMYSLEIRKCHSILTRMKTMPTSFTKVAAA